jgi:hypothetical protein
VPLLDYGQIYMSNTFRVFYIIFIKHLKTTILSSFQEPVINTIFCSFPINVRCHLPCRKTCQPPTKRKKISRPKEIKYVGSGQKYMMEDLLTVLSVARVVTLRLTIDWIFISIDKTK